MMPGVRPAISLTLIDEAAETPKIIKGGIEGNGGTNDPAGSD